MTAISRARRGSSSEPAAARATCRGQSAGCRPSASAAASAQPAASAQASRGVQRAGAAARDAPISVTAIRRNCADSFSTDTDHTNRVGQNNSSPSAMRAAGSPKRRRSSWKSSSDAAR